MPDFPSNCESNHHSDTDSSPHKRGAAREQWDRHTCSQERGTSEATAQQKTSQRAEGQHGKAGSEAHPDRGRGARQQRAAQQAPWGPVEGGVHRRASAGEQALSLDRSRGACQHGAAQQVPRGQVEGGVCGRASKGQQALRPTWTRVREPVSEGQLSRHPGDWWRAGSTGGPARESRLRPTQTGVGEPVSVGRLSRRPGDQAEGRRRSARRVTMDTLLI